MSNLSVNTITDASCGSTASINGLTPQASNMQPFNRIINGAMTIDQRNAGASLTVNSTAGFYAVDRFQARGQSSDGVFTVQQVSDSPAGFEYSLKATVTTVDSSLTSGQFYYIRYMCEGYDVADLDWGTSDAKTVTLSFWVRSSLTGTFGGVIPNVDLDRSYPFTYTISVADTWEYKTITIPGDTTGTWNKTNGIGLRVIFALGAGSDIIGTAGAWAAANYQGGATGQTNVISTNGATFYITGVQLEAGSSASSFAHENYSDTLQKCQRYYRKLSNAADPYKNFAIGRADTGNNASMLVDFIVPMRAVPTITLTSLFTDDGYATNGATIGALYLTNEGGGFNVSSSSVGGGRAVVLRANGSSSASLQYSAEL
jgi:predicted secreted protein